MRRFSLSSLLAVLFLTILSAACSRAASTPQEANQAATATPAPMATPTTPAVSFVENATEPFDTFDGIAFVRHTGFFEGETSLGQFRVPYEIVAPEDPNSGNGTVQVEPSHWLGGPLGRDRVLFRDFLFQTVSGYATVGFAENGRSILDPSAGDLLLAGEPVEDPGSIDLAGIVDEEILIQFTQALTSASFAVDVLGELERLYGYGISQTAAVLLESQRNLARTSQQGLFDFTLLHTALWRAPFPGETAFDFLGGEFEPLQGVGKAIIVESEGDLVMSEAEQFRRVAGQPNYPLYQVAGAAHAPNANNPLDHEDVAQAMFAAGDRWVRSGTAPPPTILMETAAAGQVDPVYDEATGIARGGDLNARGGVQHSVRQHGGPCLPARTGLGGRRAPI